MTRVAVNLRSFVPGRMGSGMEVYVRQAVGALDAHLSASGGSLVALADPYWHETIRGFAPAAQAVAATADGVAIGNDQLVETGADVLFCPLTFLDPPLPELPTAVMISDLYPELEPQLLTRSYRELTHQALRHSARRADVVLTMHSSTADDISERYGVERERIAVTPPAVDDEFAGDAVASEEFEALGLPERFLYYPATFYPHKNHVALIRALALLTDDDLRDVPLVLTGDDQMPDSLADEIRRLRLGNRVRALGRVERSLVIELHRRAAALTFVSRFEGFGIPPIEAMLAGTPVLASTQPVVRDVVGDAGLIVDESDPAAIATGIRQLLRDDDLRAELRRRGHARASRFSLEGASATLVGALTALAGKGRRRDAAIRYEPPTVGIVTPTFNAAEFLTETIDSVLDQDYPHIRYVVMDGGSTDGTIDLLRSYGERLEWVSGPDDGQVDAVNGGVERIGGDIVAFLNADDAYEPRAVGTAVERFRDRAGAALVWGTAHILNERGEHVRTTPLAAADHSTLASHNPIHQPAAFVSGRAWRELGGLDPSLDLAFDYDLWIRLSEGVPVYAVPDVLARVRFHPQAKTETHRGRHLRQAMEVVRRHYGYVPATWTDVYARWLANGRPSALAHMPRRRRSTAIQLPIGIYANRRAPLRAVRDWARDAGLVSAFEGRWHDGWISRRWRTRVSVPAGARRLRVKGMHHAASRRPLGLRASLDGRTLASTSLVEPGEFVLEGPIAPELGGDERELTIQASYTFRVPTDSRRLSCQIAEVSFE